MKNFTVNWLGNIIESKRHFQPWTADFAWCGKPMFSSRFNFYEKMRIKLIIPNNKFHCELDRKHNREKKAFSAGLVQPLTADFACSVVSAMPARQIIHMALTAHYGRFCQKLLSYFFINVLPSNPVETSLKFVPYIFFLLSLVWDWFLKRKANVCSLS